MDDRGLRKMYESIRRQGRSCVWHDARDDYAPLVLAGVELQLLLCEMTRGPLRGTGPKGER